MYKTIMLSFIISVSALYAQSHVFYVLDVKGQIINNRSGSLLARNDKVYDSDNLTFKTAGAIAKVLSPDKGVYKVMQSQAESHGRSLGMMITSLIEAKPGHLSTRSATDFVSNLNTVLTDKVLYFAPVSLIAPVPAKPNSYLIEMTIGAQSYSAQCTMHSDTLTIDKSELELSFNITLPENTDLPTVLFLSSKTKKSTLKKFSLKFIPAADFKDLISPLLTLYKNKIIPDASLIKFSIQILRDEYPGYNVDDVTMGNYIHSITR